MTLGGSSLAPVKEFWYPSYLPVNLKDYTVGDNFHRTTLNPTNAVALYTVVSASTGSAVIGTARDRLTLTTAAVLNDYEDVRITGVTFNRAWAGAFGAPVQQITRLEQNIIFTLGQVTDTELYIGLYRSGSTSLTALPATTEHIGVKLDISASANLFLTSANGAAEVTTDLGVAASTSVYYRLNIIHSGLNTASISVYNAVTGAQIGTTQAVTALGGIEDWTLDFFIKDEAAIATKITSIYWWNSKTT